MILKSMHELMRQTELSRTLIENKKTDSPNESTFTNIIYAEAVKTVPYRVETKFKPNSFKGSNY